MSSEPEVECSLTQEDLVQETERPFTESGKCDDEITFEFDDQKKLFVSRNFLRYASPVFDAMFSHNFKEKTQGYVKLSGKIYEDFLEFLLCIHPGFLKPVTESNVLRIVSITEEYQVKSITTRCKGVMKALLLKSVEEAKSMGNYRYRAAPLRDCFRITKTAINLNYEDFVTSGVEAIAKYGHVHYNQNQTKPFLGYGFRVQETTKSGEQIHQIEAECMEMFNGFPAEVRCRILSKRLLFWNDVDMKFN